MYDAKYETMYNRFIQEETDYLFTVEGFHCILDEYLSPKFHNTHTNALKFFIFVIDKYANKCSQIFKNSLAQYTELYEHIKVRSQSFVHMIELQITGIRALSDIKMKDDHTIFGYDALILYIDMYTNIYTAKLNKLLDAHDQLLIPSGYSDVIGGHAITLFYTKRSADNYTIYLFNSGEGLDKYHDKDEKNNKYRGILRYPNRKRKVVEKIIIGSMLLAKIYSSIEVYYKFFFDIVQSDRGFNSSQRDDEDDKIYKDIYTQHITSPIFENSSTQYMELYERIKVITQLPVQNIELKITGIQKLYYISAIDYHKISKYDALILYIDICTKIYATELYKLLGTHDQLLIPSGYSDVKGGHAVTLFYTKQSDDNYTIYLYNSGYDLDKYHDKDKKTDKYKKILRYQNRKKKAVEKIIIGSMLLPKMHSSIDVYYKFFYDTVQSDREFDSSHDDVDDDKTYNDICYIEGQFSGSCTYYSIFYFFKYIHYKYYSEDPSVKFEEAKKQIEHFVFTNMYTHISKKKLLYDCDKNYIDILQLCGKKLKIEMDYSGLLEKYEQNVMLCCDFEIDRSAIDYQIPNGKTIAIGSTFDEIKTNSLLESLSGILNLLTTKIKLFIPNVPVNIESARDIFRANLLIAYIISSLSDIVNSFEKMTESYTILNIIDYSKTHIDAIFKIYTYCIYYININKNGESYIKKYVTSGLFKIMVFLCLILIKLNEKLGCNLFKVAEIDEKDEKEIKLARLRVHDLFDANLYTTKSISFANINLFVKYYRILFEEYVVSGEHDIHCINMFTPAETINELQLKIFLMFDFIYRKTDTKQRATNGICNSSIFVTIYIDKILANIEEHIKNIYTIYTDLFRFDARGEKLKLTMIGKYNLCAAQCDNKPQYVPGTNRIEYSRDDILFELFVDTVNDGNIDFINTNVRMIYAPQNYQININNGLYTSHPWHFIKQTFVDGDYENKGDKLSKYLIDDTYNNNVDVAKNIKIIKLLDPSLTGLHFVYLLYAVILYDIGKNDEKDDVESIDSKGGEESRDKVTTNWDCIIAKIDTMLPSVDEKDAGTRACLNILKILLKDPCSIVDIRGAITEYYKMLASQEGTFYFSLRLENVRILLIKKIISRGITGDVFRGLDDDNFFAFCYSVRKTLKISQDVKITMCGQNFVNIDTEPTITVLYASLLGQIFMDNFIFVTDPDNKNKYTGESTNENIKYKLYITTSSKYYTATTLIEKIEYKLCVNPTNTYYISKLLDMFGIHNLLFISDTKYFIDVPSVFSQNGNMLKISYTDAEKKYILKDGKDEYIIEIGKKNDFGLNRWIYCIPLSFIVSKDDKYYIVLIHHVYSEYHIRNEKLPWIDRSKIPQETFIKKNNVYYIIEIAYNYLDLTFNSSCHDDIDYYVYCCIMFQKADCMRAIYGKYIATVKKDDRNKLVAGGTFNNPFNHYFNFISTNIGEYVTWDDNNTRSENIYGYIRRLTYGAYKLDHFGKYEMKITDNNIHNNNWSDIIQRDCMKKYNLSDMIIKNPITKEHTNLKDRHLVLFRREIDCFFNSYTGCEISVVNREKFIENIHVMTDTDTDVIKYNQHLVLSSRLDLVSFIVKHHEILYARLEHKLLKKFAKDIKLPECTELKRAYDHVDPKVIYQGPRSVNIIVFEILFGAYVRDEQYKIYKQIINEINSNPAHDTCSYNVQQLLMGRGKTAVIMPLVALYYLLVDDYFSNVILLMPDNLIKQSFKAFVNFFCCILSINKVFSYEHDVDILNNICEQQHYGYTVSPRNIFIIDQNNIKNILLNTLNMSTRSHQNIINTIKEKSVMIIDEFDSIYDPTKSRFNLSFDSSKIGDHKLITKKIYDYIADFVHYIVQKNNYIHRLYDKETLVNLLGDFNTVNSDGHDMDIPFIIKLLNIKKNHRDQIPVADLKGVIIEKVQFYEIKTIEKLFYTLISVCNMLYNHAYGFPTKDSHGNNHYTAVPYDAAYSPSIGSKFSEIDIILISTLFAYMYNTAFRNVDTVNLLEYFRDNSILTIRDNLSEGELQTSLGDNFRFLGITVDELCNFNLTNTYIIDAITSNINALDSKSKYSLILEYLKNKIIPSIEYSDKFVGCSAIDIISSSFSKYKCGFSGFVMLNLPIYYDGAYEFVNINSRDEDNGSIYFAILGGYASIPETYPILSFIKLESDIVDKIINLIVSDDNKYDAFIDSGAFFVNNTAEEIVEIFLKRITNKNIFIYIDKRGNKKQHKRGNKLPTDYNDDIYTVDDKVFILYDNQHIIGQDIKQPYKFKALVSVNNFNKLSDVAQACFRLRNLNYGHTVDFIVYDGLAGNLNTREELLTYLYNKEKNLVDGSTELEKLKQNCEYLKRKFIDSSDIKTKYKLNIHSDYDIYYYYFRTTSITAVSYETLNSHHINTFIETNYTL